jgi:hypothetical protein
MSRKKIDRVKKILLTMNRGQGWWPWLQYSNRRIIKKVSKKRANKFLLGCIVDYQQNAIQAWLNAARLAEKELGDPENLWEVIGAYPKSRWYKLRRRYSWLHWLSQAHGRVWRIARSVRDNYEGDARNIWEGQVPEEVLKRLNRIRLGKQLSRMAVGALIDTKHIKGKSDIKADRHVKRVLGRVFFGKELDEGTATKIAKRLNKNPWKMDSALFVQGMRVCKKSDPKCTECKLAVECSYYNRKRKKRRRTTS